MADDRWWPDPQGGAEADEGRPAWTAPTVGASAGGSGADDRRQALAIVGGVIAIVGVVTAVVLWIVADRRHQSTIEEFARAPAGCDTTLAFESDGRYLLYLETSGVLDQTAGDCAARGTFDRLDSTRPAFEVAVVGTDGAVVALSGHPPIDYDIDGFTGSSVGSVQIDAAGEYVIRVASADDDFVVAVGPDPDEGAAMLRLVAISAVVAGLVVGGTCLVLAASRGRQLRSATTWDDASSARPAAPGAQPHGWESARPPLATGPPRSGPGSAASGPRRSEIAGSAVPGEALHPPVRTEQWGPPTDRAPGSSVPPEDQ